MGLEDLVKKFSEQVVKPGIEIVRKTCAWPKSLGLIAASFAYTAALSCNAGAESSVYVLGIGFSVYYCASLVDTYVFSNRHRMPRSKDGGLVKRINLFSLENPRINATVFSVFNTLATYEVMNAGLGFLEHASVFGPLSYIGAFAFFNCRTQNILFNKLYEHSRKNKGLVSKLVTSASDALFEHPAVAASLAGMACFWHMSPKMDFAGISAGSLFSVYAAGAAYVLDTLAAGMLHSTSLRFLYSDVKLSALSVFKKEALLEAEINNLLGRGFFPRKKSSYFAQLASSYLRRSKVDFALLNMKEYIVAAQEETRVHNPYDFLREFSGFNSLWWDAVQNIVITFRGEPNRSLQYAVQAIKEKDYSDMQKHLDRAIGISGEDSRFQIIKALAMDAVRMDASEEWKTLLHHIIQEYKDKFKQISFTSKEVLKLSFDKLLANTFVFVRDDAGSAALRREHDISRFAFSCYSDGASVPQPYYFGTNAGRAYSVSSHLPGLPLSEQSITEAEVLGSLQAYFDFCLRTTAGKEKMPDFSASAPEPGYMSIFDEKFLARVPFDAAKKEWLRRYFLPAITRLESKPRRFTHGNLHPGNIIKGSGRYGLIDFGDACFANVCFGVEQLLGHHIVHCGDKQNVHQKAYAFAEGVSRDEFLEDCALSSAFVASHLFGRSVHYQEGPSAHYKTNLVQSVNFLAENFVTGAEKAGLRDFAEEIQCSEIK